MSDAQLRLSFPPRKVGQKRAAYVWWVMAVLEDGRCIGNCGHDHETTDEATACDWAPLDWDDYLVCDLLVRKVRDRRIDPPRTRRSKAA